MKTAVLIVAAAAGLAACAPPLVNRAHQRLKPISRLDCPDSEGALTRSSQAADGSSCVYSGPNGSTVQLKLTPVSGAPEAVILPLEAQIRSEAPPEPTPVVAPATGPHDDHDKVDIRLPGVSIHADDQGARVHVPGVNIDADDQHNQVHVVGHPPGRPDHGQVTIDANDDAAVVHVHAFGPNFDEMLIRASKTPGPQGWRTVGYEALGPRSGPLVVATVQSRAEEHDTLFNDVKALVRRVARG